MPVARPIVLNPTERIPGAMRLGAISAGSSGRALPNRVAGASGKAGYGNRCGLGITTHKAARWRQGFSLRELVGLEKERREWAYQHLGQGKAVDSGPRYPVVHPEP